MNKTKIPKIPKLLRTSARVTSPPDTKTIRESTEHIESFIFCRRSHLNSQNSQQESSGKFGKFRKFESNRVKKVLFDYFVNTGDLRDGGCRGAGGLSKLRAAAGGERMVATRTQARQGVCRGLTKLVRWYSILICTLERSEASGTTLDPP